jgi:hypothetical protein
MRSRCLVACRGPSPNALDGKTIVELVFGQIQMPRGFRRFGLRDLDPAKAECLLRSAVHNLGKLFTTGRRRAPWSDRARVAFGWQERSHDRPLCSRPTLRG